MFKVWSTWIFFRQKFFGKNFVFSWTDFSSIFMMFKEFMNLRFVGFSCFHSNYAQSWKHISNNEWSHVAIHLMLMKFLSSTMFESKNGWQKIEQVPIWLPRDYRNFPNVKTRNEKKIYNCSIFCHSVFLSNNVALPLHNYQGECSVLERKAEEEKA